MNARTKSLQKRAFPPANSVRVMSKNYTTNSTSKYHSVHEYRVIDLSVVNVLTFCLTSNDGAPFVIEDSKSCERLR
jgi:hypothetical protein